MGRRNHEGRPELEHRPSTTTLGLSLPATPRPIPGPSAGVFLWPSSLFLLRSRSTAIICRRDSAALRSGPATAALLPVGRCRRAVAVELPPAGQGYETRS